MKQIMFAVMLCMGLTGWSQSAFGIKGGLNYGATGDLETFSIFENGRIDSENKAGYHVGLFAKFRFSNLFLQPEVVYTKLNSGYEDNDLDASYDLTKIDIPLLLGLEIVGPLTIKAGPSVQYILEDTFEANAETFQTEDPERSLTVGYQLGVGLELGRLGFDLRYEGAFQENTVVSDRDLQDAGFEIDARPKQWILSVSYRFITPRD